MINVPRILLSGIVFSIAALAQPAIDQTFNFGQAKPGTDLTVPGKNFPSSTEIVLAILPKGLQIKAKSAVPTALVFPLPQLDPGDYTATITFPQDATNPVRTLPLAGALSIPKPQTAAGAEPSKNAAKISQVAPATAYATDKGRFNFEIFGENFPEPKPGMYLLAVNGIVISPIEVRTVTETCTSAAPSTANPTAGNATASVVTPCLRWLGPEHLEVSGIPRVQSDEWNQAVSVRINGVWVGPTTLVFSRWQRPWPFLAAAGFVAASVSIILLAFRKKRGATAGAQYNVITRFLLDADTNSYSLSKFQTFSWLTIIVFTYIYVLFCRITIQGVTTSWPEFPGSLAGMFGLSLGAMVASTAVSDSKGNKGAGPADPSFADFFSTGGVVAADRFQFFLWTLVGFFGYLSLLWFNDPGKLSIVPPVPDGLLYLMGVSAGGYVGGKLARAPGPNITGLKASADLSSNTLHLRIQGDNLSPAATFQIGGQEVRTVVRPVNVISTAAGKPSFATDMEIVIAAPASAWLVTGAHTLRLINDDGQFAEKDYSIGFSITGPVTKAPGVGGMTISIPTLTLAAGINRVDLELTDSAGSVFRVAGVSPSTPPPTQVSVPGANPALPATVLITALDGSSAKVTFP